MKKHFLVSLALSVGAPLFAFAEPLSAVECLELKILLNTEFSDQIPDVGTNFPPCPLAIDAEGNTRIDLECEKQREIEMERQQPELAALEARQKLLQAQAKLRNQAASDVYNNNECNQHFVNLNNQLKRVRRK